MRHRTTRPTRPSRARHYTPLSETLESRLVLSQFVVSPTGNDAGSGTASSPWLTLQHAANSVHPGDDVEVLAGQYAGFSMTNGGAAVAPITIRADPGAVITSPNPATPDGINLQGASYVDIEGFQITGMPRDGIRSVSDTGVTIRDNAISQSASWGIYAGISSALDVEGNTVSQSKQQGGIYASGSGAGPGIRGNVAWGDNGPGIQVVGDASQGGNGILTGAAIAGNVIHDDGAGISGDGLQGSTIQNNLLYNINGNGISLYRANGGGPSSGDLVVNNTVVVATDGGWALSVANGATGDTAYNNIFYSGAPAGGSIAISADSLSGFTSDYNEADRFSANGGGATLGLSAWQASTGRDGHSFASTPSALFANPSAGDYHLSATSPAINAGTMTSAPATDLEGRARPARTTIDVGAYELPAVLASFVKQDDTTQGNWIGTYGSQGYEVVGGSTSLPGYAGVGIAGGSIAYWNGAANDVRGLERSSTDTSRVAGTYYTYSNFTVSLTPTDSKAHQVALYLVDWDSNNSRVERVDLINPADGSVLDSKLVSNFSNGRYLVWDVSGPVAFRVTAISGRSPSETNAVLSGIFFDAATPAAPVPTTPYIVSETPADVTGIGGSTLVSATLNEAIDPSTASFVLTDLQNQVIPSTTTYDATRHVITLIPVSPLMDNDRYTATLSGIQQAPGNAMATASWAFDVGSDPHSTDLIKQAEHLAIFKLVPHTQVTDFALRSGSWGDPSVWSDGAVPTTGDRVDIPAGISVQVDGLFAQSRVQSLFVEGTLRFNPDVNTSLEVVTTIVGPDGYFEIGTAQHRVAANVTAQFIIGNRGVRDAAMRLADPLDYTGGFISHGMTSLYGALYTSSATPSIIPRAGNTSITLSSVPNGWKVGDTLLFAGLSLTANQDETRTIVAVSPDGLTYTFNSPLAYDHGGIYGYSQAAPVGNMTRNVIFSSEDSTDLVDRGHVMFMHTQNEVIDSVAFVGLGRTSAQTQETFPKLDANGVLVPGTDANTAGRYAVHFHIRDGATYAQTPAVITNSVIDTSPKIGIDNHGGYALITNNLTYEVDGAGIFTENGSEIGTISGNMTVRSHGSNDNLDGRHGQNGDPNDYGFSGTGIWVQGGGVTVLNNFSSGQSGAAFTFFANSIVDDSPSPSGYSVFLAQNLKDPSIAGGLPYIDVSTVPLDFEGDVGIASGTGLTTWSFDLFSIISPAQSLIANSSFINNSVAWGNGYSRHFSLVNDRLIGGDPQNFRQVFYDDAISGNEETSDISMTNVTIDGYVNAYSIPQHGDNEIHGGYITGTIYVPGAYGGKLDIEGVTWGIVPGAPSYHIVLENTYTSGNLKALPGDLQPMLFTYNGQTVYYDSQAAGFVPFSGISPDLDGKTNQQLWAQYGLAIGGRIAPGKLTQTPDIIGGSIGNNVPTAPSIKTSDLLYGQVYDWSLPQIVLNNPYNYSGTVTIAGVTYTSAPRNLHVGWNVITIATPSGPASFLVSSQFDSGLAAAISTQDPGTVPAASAPTASVGAAIPALTPQAPTPAVVAKSPTRVPLPTPAGTARSRVIQAVPESEQPGH